MFRSKFDSWPETTNVAVSEDGRGKVAGQCLQFFEDVSFPTQFTVMIVMVKANIVCFFLVL